MSASHPKATESMRSSEMTLSAKTGQAETAAEQSWNCVRAWTGQP
jgi:hypothetical protein